MKPRLSVVVPLYNVEDYLEECLRSVAGQTMADFEALMVDDGSTDGSPEIAARFARRDPRFRLVRQENAGLSAARNTGVRRCAPGTEFLAFVDSDDVVPPRAYERLIGSLDRTGSDFATGNVWRLDGEGRSQAWQYRWLERSRERTHITRDRRLLADRVAWNKVFRRAFWDRHGFAFPEGKLYEDIPVTIPAHVLARSVDVLHEHIYYWRIREGSITRRRTDVRGVRDRIAACDGVSRFLAERAAAEPGPRWAGFKRAYDIRVLGDDLVYFMEGLPMGGSEYRSAFMTGATDFLSRADPGIITELPVDLRIKWHLVHEQRLAELLELLAFERTNGKTFAVTGRPGRRSARYPRPGGGGIRVSARLARLRRAELPVVARVQEAAWRGGRLRLTGYAYIRNLDVTAARHSLKQALLRSAGGKRIRLLPTRTVSAPEATENSGQRMHCYDLSGFEITIDPAGLRAGGRRRPTTWQLGLMIAGHGVLRRAALRAEDSSSAQPLVHDLDDGTRLVLAYRAGRLELRVQEVAVRVAGHRRVGEDVELSGSVRAGLRPTALRLSHQGTDTAFDYPVVREPGTGRAGWADFSVRLRPADLQGVPPVVSDAPKEVEPLFGDRWQARLVLANGRSRGVTAAPGLGPGRYRGGPGADRELCLTADALGDLVPELTRQPIADRVAWAQDGTVLIEGPVADAGRRRPELVLRHSTRHEEVRVPVEVGDGRFRASLAPAAVPVPGHGTLPLREGRWYAFLRDPGEAAMPVRLLASVHGSLPLRRTAGGREFRLERRFGDRLLIVSGSVLAPLERGAYRRHTLRGSYYPRRRAQPLSDTVLYFDGDAPRAVHEELVRRGTDCEHLWVTHDRQTLVPPTALGVAAHSAAWYEALARSRRIVTSGQLPEWFERREGQIVLQTWQGVPLKRIGTDLTGTLYADHQRLGALPRLARQWSVLVSPSRFSTPHLRRALAYDGEILQAGSPHNDVLFAAEREKTAERVRRRLDLPPDKRVVLYAPTYRDHLAYGPGRFRLELALDLAAAERALGADHVLLVRGHPLTVNGAPGARAPFARDVSRYPGVSELLLVADVLITDYSALAVDFVHTGRPVLFHTYDLELYRDTLRGFYIDLEAEAPGPLLRTTGDLIAALRDPDGTAARHARAYERFRTAYGDLDDGSAASRVADRLLGRGGSSIHPA